MKQYKPMLAPNQEVNLDEINYPLLASFKLDGIRIIFYKGQIFTRSLKQLPNKQLRKKFEPIRKYSEDNNLILDGEIYSHELNFQEIISFCMTQDFTDKKSIKKHGKILTIPDHLKFYCFDCIENDNLNTNFKDREEFARLSMFRFPDIAFPVEQFNVDEPEEVKNHFNKALENGYEGLILKDSNGKYKYGRCTLKEGLIYKIKFFRTFDATIISVVQATKVNPNAEKKINELGRSVTSKKKDDRILINKASAFFISYKFTPLKVVLAMTDEEKEIIWRDKENYIGRMIEYKGMKIGAKDVPRHPTFVRFRPDKN